MFKITVTQATKDISSVEALRCGQIPDTLKIWRQEESRFLACTTRIIKVPANETQKASWK